MVAAASTAVHRHTAGHIEVAGALRVLLRHLQTHLPRPTGRALHLLHNSYTGHRETPLRSGNHSQLQPCRVSLYGAACSLVAKLTGTLKVGGSTPGQPQ